MKECASRLQREAFLNFSDCINSAVQARTECFEIFPGWPGFIGSTQFFKYFQ